MEKLKKNKENIQFFLTICSAITIIWGICSFYFDSKRENEELIYTLKTTQQMSLKSVIWNESIPIAERASACDVYLNAGYNSLTKKECEIIIQQGEEQGIFRLKGDE